MLSRRLIGGSASLSLLGALCAAPNLAMCTPLHLAQAGGVKGQDVLEDRGKSNADGYVWAPLSRDKGSSENSPGENNPNRGTTSENRPGPVTGKTLSPGEDPGTPMQTPSTKAGANTPSVKDQ